MLAAVIALALVPFPVRAELVEALPFLAKEKDSPSTSSGRTEAEDITPIDAERAFAADAKTIGQWTAFRKWSTDDAVMFTPQPVNAHEFLKDRKDPTKAIDWWPTASWISCDGKLAVNTGGWKRPDGTDGYFTTIWLRQVDGGWKWLIDHGDSLTAARPRPAQPAVRRASCEGRPTNNVPFTQYRWAGLSMPAGAYVSNATLRYGIHIGSTFGRRFEVAIWTGRRWEVVLGDDVSPSPNK